MPGPQTLVSIFNGETLLARFDLIPGEYVLGRENADLLVDDETLDAHHAKLILEPQNVFIDDLGSTMGTYVNKTRVTGKTQLFSRQKIMLGPVIRVDVRRQPVPPEVGDSTSPQTAVLVRLFPDQFIPDQKYDVEEPVGEGGMGRVLKTRELPIRRSVAMKVMTCEPTEDSMARFVEEAQITGQLEHPNITPVHELGVDEFGRLFYTMKLIRGVTLKRVLNELKERNEKTITAYPLARLLDIFQKICDAVSFAHSKGVIHCDLKPENIMIGTFGEVMLTDWGLAKMSATSPPSKGELVTLTGISLRKPVDVDNRKIAGSAHYMSPEQARAENDSLDFRSDIYSLGAILYHLLYLEKPIQGETFEEIVHNVRAGWIGPDRCLASSLEKTRHAPAGLPHLAGGRPPVSLLAVAGRAMRLTRSERYQSVAELQLDLAAYKEGYAPSAEHASAYRQMQLAVVRYKREFSIAVMSFFVLTCLGIYVVFKVSKEKAEAEQQRIVAEQALADLASTPPVLAELARILTTQERFPEALEKLNYALKLKPGHPEYLIQKGNLLESQMQFAAAKEAYEEAEKSSQGAEHDRAVLNAGLCERLNAAMQKDKNLSRAELVELLEVMAREDRSTAERMLVSSKLGEERRFVIEHWLQRLRDLPVTPDLPLSKRLLAREDGLLTLNLEKTALADLHLLEGMPLAELDLSECKKIVDITVLGRMPNLEKLSLKGTSVPDLTALQGLHLKHLSIRGTQIANLAFLSGQPLESVDCSLTPVVDFKAIAKPPLETLLLENSQVEDLSFLKGTELKVLRLDGCKGARGLGVLSEIPSLELLVLPSEFYQWSAVDLTAIQQLRFHPGLRQITADIVADAAALQAEPKEKFWAKWEKDLAWLYQLRSMGLTPILHRFENGTWDVELKNQNIQDLICLNGCRLHKLDVYGTLVHDLAPLQGQATLESLDLRKSQVSDLSPLAGMRLKELMLWENNVTNFEVLKTLKDLETLDLSQVAEFSDLSLLGSRNLRLLRIGSTKVTDLSPLAGMPLEKLHCDNIVEPDLSPLMKCLKLKWLVFPRKSENVELLRNHPSLQKMSYYSLPESEPTMTCEQFWTEYPNIK